MVTVERKRELMDLWDEEKGKDRGKEWRAKLNSEELEMVRQWDKAYYVGIYHMCLDIIRRLERGENVSMATIRAVTRFRRTRW